MRTRTFLRLLFIVALILTGGCKKDSNPVDGGSQTILMPLKIGYQWTYRTILFDTSGVQQSGADTNTFKIVRDTTIQNETWYFIGRDSTAYELLTNRADGLWYMRVRVAPQAAALFAKYPSNVNDTWIGPDCTTATVLAKDVSVTVPQGTYSCFQYTYADKSTQFVSQARYFPVGNGFVRDEGYSRTNSGRSYVRVRRELIGLSLSKSSSEPTMTTRGLSNVGMFYNMEH